MAPSQSETFRNPRRIPTPLDPVTVTTGDLNNDGSRDILYVTGSSLSYAAHPLIAQPNGDYLPGVDLSLPNGIGPRCRLADVNNDGKLDLICASNAFASVAVFRGNGDGAFQSAVTTTLPNGSSGGGLAVAAIGDVNNDKNPDLIITDAINSRILVLLGDGAGKFTLASTPSDGGYPDHAALQDLNGDGNLDIVSNGANGYRVAVFLGHGDGTFSAGAFYPNNGSTVMCDVDGDGHADLIGGGRGQLTILHGNADGTFASSPIATVSYATGTSAAPGDNSYINSYACLDLNGDGIPDILANGSDGLTLILGKPNLQFATPTHYPVGQDTVGNNPDTLVDMDGDGHPDLVAAGANGVYISYGRPDGSFVTGNVYESGTVIAGFTVADVNGDNIPDVVTNGGTQLQLSLGNGDGTFRAATPIPGNFTSGGTALSPNGYILHGDFNGDGYQDILTIASNATLSGVFIVFGHGDGTFDSPVALPAQVSVTGQSFIADFNHDGRDDIATLSSGQQPVLTVFLTLPNNAFQFGITNLQGVPGEAFSASYTFADLNQDGYLDLIYTTTNHLITMLGGSSGTFASPSTFSIPAVTGAYLQNPGSVSTGDFDGDGKPDIAVLIPYQRFYGDIWASPAQIDVFYNNGYPNLSTPVTTTTSLHSYGWLSSSDLDHDGLTDLIYDNSGDPYSAPASPNFGVVHGLPQRSLSAETNYIAGAGAAGAVIVDLNHDSFPEIIVSNATGSNNSANSFTVLLNQGNTPTATGSLTLSPEPSPLGHPITITANLTPPASSPSLTLTGTVTFVIDGNPVGSTTISHNTATFTPTSSLSIGIHHVAATWSGMTSSGVTVAPLTLTATHTVSGYPLVLSLTAQPNPAGVGQSVTLGGSVTGANGSEPAPTGSITVSDNGQVIFSGSGTTLPALSRGFAPGGTHTLRLSYSGDANHDPSSTTTSLNITPVASTLSLTSSVNTSSYGQTVTFSATLSDNLDVQYYQVLASGTVTLSGLPGGPVTIFMPSLPPPGTKNTAIYTTNAIPAGTGTVTATFNGNASLNSSTSAPLTQVISPGSTTTTLAVYPHAAQTVFFSANVAGPIPYPTGTVQFLDGTTVLGTGTLSSGTATFTSTSLSLGSHSFTAVYQGDANNASSTSTSVSQSIQPYDFSLSATPSSVSVVGRGSAAVTLTITSIGTFAEGTILSLSSVPSVITAKLSANNVTPAAGGSTPVTLSINAQLNNAAANHHPVQQLRLVLALLFAPVFIPSLRRRSFSMFLGPGLALGLFSGISGCSGKSSAQPQSYSLQINATGVQSQLTHSLTVPVTITQ